MLKEIEQRRSIRKYEHRIIEPAKLQEVLHAAMCAPSAHNTKSTRYVVIEKREALDALVTLQPYMGMMKEAPCAIMVLGDKRAEENDDYLYVNASAAIENLLLEAVHQGLSTCWCAIGPRQERIENFRNYFDLDEQLLPIAAIAIGYGAEVKNNVPEYNEAFVRFIK